MPETTEPTYPGRSNSVVSYGVPFPELTVTHLDRLNRSRAYIIVSGSLAKNYPDEVQKLRTALAEKLVGERIGLAPHSKWSEILEVGKDIALKKPDAFIVLGGGTGTDSTKVLTLVHANPPKDGNYTHEYLETLSPQSVSWTDKGPDAINPPTAIQVSIPTTLSAGEYSPFAGAVDDRSGVKRSFSHPDMAPNVVLLDPALASLTPDWVWLSTGVRAIDHCVETLCSLKADEDSDSTASEGLAKLVRGLLITKHGATGQEGLNARLESMLGARMAMAAPIRQIPMGGSHAIGHQLGTFGVAHGHTSCVMCPYVMRYNKSVNEEKQKKATDVIWESDPKVRGYLEARGLERGEADLCDVLDGLFRELEMPRTLKEVGVEGERKLKDLAEKTLKDHWAGSNPRPLESADQVMEILKMAI